MHRWIRTRRENGVWSFLVRALLVASVRSLVRSFVRSSARVPTTGVGGAVGLCLCVGVRLAAVGGCAFLWWLRPLSHQQREKGENSRPHTRSRLTVLGVHPQPLFHSSVLNVLNDAFRWRFLGVVFERGAPLKVWVLPIQVGSFFVFLCLSSPRSSPPCCLWSISTLAFDSDLFLLRCVASAALPSTERQVRRAWFVDESRRERESN